MQGELGKLKPRLTIQEYRQLYPKDSKPSRFHGTAKLNKLPTNGTIEEPSIRLILSNIGTTSCCLATHLAKNLYSLRQFAYSIKKTFDLIEKIENIQIPLNLTMVSLHLKPLFISVSLTETVDIILDRVYNSNEIPTALIKNEMKKFLTSFIKHIYFTLNN